ncbi:trihydroxytoluene oxygenase [Xylaria sp. CBS 124048]|nr:trihydroxytoluene oxygenase [Xylaria sp. CBS 124048]
MDTQKPNQGAAIPDSIAVGNHQEDVRAWRARKKIDVNNQIKLVKLAHMRYQHPDLEPIIQFMADFGMTVAKKTDEEIWLRGYGPDPYVYYAKKGPKKFLGGTFLVETYEDLERAAKLPGSSDIQNLEEAPGGGSLVTVYDPEGFPVNLIHGQAARVPVPEEQPSQLAYNFENEKPRVREFLRFKQGPAAIHKLGHYGLSVQNFQGECDFYLKTFNLVPSDFIYVDQPGNDVGLFAHIDRGDSYVDHHSFFLNKNATSHVHHSSYEVHDYDTQMLGHQWLAKKGYESVWGVGRHVLGSQIFDYWFDTSRNIVEHYIDGDVVNQETPIGFTAAGSEALAVWGPDVPAWFLE